MNSPNRPSFPHLPDPNEQSLFSPSQNDFSPFSPPQHRVFDHFMPLLRSLLSFQESTGNLDILNELLSKCEVIFSRKRIPNFVSNGNSAFWGLLKKSDFGFYRSYRPLSGRMFTFTLKTQKCKRSTKIDKGIGKEMLLRKFESNEMDREIICFGLNFCRFVEKFNVFKISNLGYIEVILSTKWIFPYVSTFWSYFESSLNFIPHCNVHLNLNLLWKRESMIRNIKSIYFVNTIDRMDCYTYFCNLFDEKKWESFVERKRYFCSSAFEIGMKIGGSDRYFALRMNEISESQIFLYSENENESIVSERDEVRELFEIEWWIKN
jgi:hypothetical protein